MTAAGARRALRVAAVIVVGAGYPIVSHHVSMTPPPAGFGTVLFAVLPVFAVVMALGWRAHRLPALVLCAAAAVLLWREADAIGRHLPLVYLLQYLSFNVALMAMFAASLRTGHEPLVTRVAAMVRGRPLAPPIARYTRSATIAWTLFFATMIVVSLALYFAAPFSVWTAFANLLSLPLVGLMFVAEYVVRRRVLRDVPHSPLSTTIRAWWSTGHPSDRLPARPR